LEEFTLKICYQCQEEKPITDFPKNRTKVDGLDIRCKACIKEKNRLSYFKHKDKRRTYAREYSKKHPERRAEIAKAYRETHKEQLREYHRAYHASHKARRSKTYQERRKLKARLQYANDPAYREACKQRWAAYRKANLGKVRETLREWVAKNREHVREKAREHRARKTIEERRAMDAAARQKHRAKRQAKNAEAFKRRYGAEGEITNTYLNELHHWSDHCCWYCGKPLEGKETLEHIVPLARGGTNYPYNVVLSCTADNFSKQDRLFHAEWMPRECQPAPIWHSKRALALLLKSLKEQEIEATVNNGALRVGDLTVLPVSSFWQRAHIKPVKTIPELRQDYPHALILLDHEILKRCQGVVNVIKARIKATESIGARKLSLDAPSYQDAQAFFNHWHLQGVANGAWILGLRDAQTWRAMAIFRDGHDYYEIARMAFAGHVTGGVSKLIEGFRIAAPEPKPLMTYVDTRFGEGDGYIKAGMSPFGETALSYLYANSVGVFNRRTYTLERMAVDLDFFDSEKTERENATINGLIRVETLPQKRFVLE
jgi:hypothetical protein